MVYPNPTINSKWFRTQPPASLQTPIPIHHITLILLQLHWLLVKLGKNIKAICNLTTLYLSNLLQSPARLSVPPPPSTALWPLPTSASWEPQNSGTHSHLISEHCLCPSFKIKTQISPVEIDYFLEPASISTFECSFYFMYILFVYIILLSLTDVLFFYVYYP